MFLFPPMRQQRAAHPARDSTRVSSQRKGDFLPSPFRPLLSARDRSRRFGALFGASGRRIGNNTHHHYRLLSRNSRHWRFTGLNYYLGANAAERCIVRCREAASFSRDEKNRGARTQSDNNLWPGLQTAGWATGALDRSPPLLLLLLIALGLFFKDGIGMAALLALLARAARYPSFLLSTREWKKRRGKKGKGRETYAGTKLKMKMRAVGRYPARYYQRDDILGIPLPPRCLPDGKDPSRNTDLIQSDFQAAIPILSESSVSSLAWRVRARAAIARRNEERNCFVHRADMVRNGLPSDRLRRRSRTSIIENHDGIIFTRTITRARSRSRVNYSANFCNEELYHPVMSAI